MTGKRTSAEEEVLPEMALREHLRELRNVILVSCISLVVFSAISLYFFDPIVKFLYAPFEVITGLKT